MRRAIATRSGLVAAVVVLVLALAPPATAHRSAFYPVQSAGDRGTDVGAIQNLLRARGYAVTPNSIFRSSTTAAVKSLQARSGLPADGVVRASTYQRLVIVLRRGSSGDAVRALQLLLNQKRGAGLSFTGFFGDATFAAVLAFQRHVGLSPDGVVNGATWKNLFWHYERPDFRPVSLCDYSDTTGNGTAANWGTASIIATVEAAALLARGSGAGSTAVGDLSLEHGGDIRGHATHELGLDADLRPIRRDRLQCRWGTSWRWSSYDRTATRALVRALRAAAPGHIRLIYFNDPVLVREGLTRAYPGHDDHLHVRFCERAHPDARYVC